MSYTPLSRLRVETAPPAKAAKAAKVGDGSGLLDPQGGSERPTLAGVAALAEVSPCNTTADRLAERGAIIQEGAGVPPDWADGFARLEALPVPRGVDAAAWLVMLNAAGRFLDEWGGKAAALGWTPGELFGLDPDAPLRRLDRRGAAFLLTRGPVVAITAEAITLKISGSAQCIRRRDGLTVLAWAVFG